MVSFVVEMILFFISECIRKLNCMVRMEIEENNCIVVFNCCNRFVIFSNDSWNNEFIIFVISIRSFDKFDWIFKFFIFSVYDCFVCFFNMFLVFIMIYCVEMFRNSSNCVIV